MDWEKIKEDLTAEERRSFYASFQKWMELIVATAKRNGKETVSIVEIERGLESSRDLGKKFPHLKK